SKLFATTMCMVVNTKRLADKHLPMPTTWEDLINPVYKGEIALPSPVLASVSIFGSADSSDFGCAASKSVAIFVISLLAMALIWRLENAAARHRAPKGDRAEPESVPQAAE
ncbi:MAG TPA: ABC transporter substrate-binding protein, partial [Devosiaceae bacterium]|nr:ABC transporter substrate-binding protein [Devosiaceae bacterium]